MARTDSIPWYEKIDAILALRQPKGERVDGGALKVAIHLARRCGSKDDCFPSVESIADATAMTKANVLAAIRRIEADGIFFVARSRGRGHATTYTFNRAIIAQEKVSDAIPISAREKVLDAIPFASEEKVSDASEKVLDDPLKGIGCDTPSSSKRHREGGKTRACARYSPPSEENADDALAELRGEA